jgi:hypothetical protein
MTVCACARACLDVCMYVYVCVCLHASVCGSACARI